MNINARTRTTRKRIRRKRFTVKPVWRTILKKNEKIVGENGVYFQDVLECNHAVLVDEETRTNTYRRARSCEVCREAVQRHHDHHRRHGELAS